METAIYLPPFEMPVKPKYGSPCNGCGWCCQEEICLVGKIFFGLGKRDDFIKGPCPAMSYENGKVRCGVVLAEERCGLDPRTAIALGIGQGCDADDPPLTNPKGGI